MDKKALTWALVVAVVATGVYFLLSSGMVRQEPPAGAPQDQASAAVRQYNVGRFTFDYPDRYEISSRAEGEIQVLTLLPKGYVPPVAGEGPPAITLSIYPDADETPIEDRIKNDPRLNFQLSPDKVLTPVTLGNNVAGGLSYRYSGLYESRAVAMASAKQAYVFTVGWLSPNDQIVSDFDAILKSIR